MVISELAKTKITKLLQQENANLLKILLAGNASVGFQTIITFETTRPKEFITITTGPLVVTDPRSYVQLANSLLDFDDQTNELKFKM